MENLNTYEIKEITDLLKNDLYIIENEETEKEKENLIAEIEDLKENAETTKQETDGIIEDYNKTAINTDQFIDFLENRGLLTENLKNEIEYFKKFINVFEY